MNKNLILLAAGSVGFMFATAQNVGIGTTTPNAPLQFSNDVVNRKLVLYDNNNNDHQYYGFGINGGVLRYQVDATAADHAFYAGAGLSSSNELFRIKGNGNVSIGALFADHAGLTVDKKVGGTHALFGSNTTGVAIESALPGIGFNTYNFDIRRTISTGYGGYIGVNSSGGGMSFAVSSSSSPAGNPIAMNTAIYIKPDGSVGLNNTAPNAPLQLSNSVQSRKIVLYEASNNDHMFYGFGVNASTLRYQVPTSGDNHVFYSGIQADGSNELFRINGDGNVGIGVSNPGFLLDVGARMRIRSRPGGSAGLWLNNNANNATPAFIGMNTDDQVGFYGAGGANWGFTMNTMNGALQVNGSAGQSGQILASKGPNTAAAWVNPGTIIKTEYSNQTDWLTLPPTGLFEFTNAAYTITLQRAARVILYYKTITNKFCVVGSCSSKWRLFVYLDGVVQGFGYSIDGQSFAGASGGDGGFESHGSYGPDYFDLGPGTHTFTFYGNNVFNQPGIRFQALSTIIEQ